MLYFQLCLSVQRPTVLQCRLEEQLLHHVASCLMCTFSDKLNTEHCQKLLIKLHDGQVFWFYCTKC